MDAGRPDDAFDRSGTSNTFLVSEDEGSPSLPMKRPSANKVLPKKRDPEPGEELEGKKKPSAQKVLPTKTRS